MIRECGGSDFDGIFAVINDGAAAYRGGIPAECWHEPYMPVAQLKKDIASGVEFYGYEEGGQLTGVMGIQHFDDVTLIRHAYVRTTEQGKGIGGKLLTFLLEKTDKPVLIGTWRDTPWSIKFYEKHGFRVIGKTEVLAMLSRYWDVSEVHRDNSVVLADAKWFNARD
jgi:GNAT superfamily N-acetyltransferase